MKNVLKQENNEPLPDKMPELKVQGFLGFSARKRLCYIMDRTVTGRLAHILKSASYGYINIITVNIGRIEFMMNSILPPTFFSRIIL